MNVLKYAMRSIKLPLTTSIRTEALQISPCEGGLLQRFLPFMNTELQAVRTNIRKYFRRPSEYKRVVRHGFRKRMDTLAGRKILMNRILKGRHVLSH